MESTTVRCPNCRKKQEEPYPKRCGCGQSLLSVLTASAVATVPRLGTAALAGRTDDRAQFFTTGPLQAAARVDLEDNEW